MNLLNPTIEDLRELLTLTRPANRLSKRKDYGALRDLLMRLTSYLPIDASYSRRLWHIREGMGLIPLCPNCGINELKFDAKTTMSYGTLCKTCGIELAKRKRTATMERKYGVSNPLRILSIKEKVKTTNLDRYGVENPMQNTKVIEKTQSTNLKKYGAKYASMTDTVKEKTTHATFEKIGRYYPNQRAIDDDAWTVLSNASSLTELHHGKKLTLERIACILGVDHSTVCSYFSKYGIEVKRYQQSEGERELSQFLTDNGVPHKTRVTGVISSELDLFLPDYKFAIEFHGLYWHSEARQSNKNIHHEKWKECNENGIRLIQIFEDEWYSKKEIVKNKILTLLNHSLSAKVYARRCTIDDVSQLEKNNFFNENHIQGDGPSSINYGLYHNGELVACMGFIKNKSYYILNRYATSCNVPGGFSKLLKHFVKIHGSVEIITFADLRWSNGQLYENNEFVLNTTIRPDYFWVKGIKRWHKFNWRHSAKLKDLPNYDKNISESENMHAHGFFRIWDAGKLKYTRKG